MSVSGTSMKIAAVAALCVAMAACAAKPDYQLTNDFGRGAFGSARAYLRSHLRAPKGDKKDIDRNYLLDRMRLALVTIDDGYTVEADATVGDVYELLTKQGINKDKTVSSVVLNEDLKIWKGEPYEQALMLHYIAAHWASQQSWDNARAAISRSLFHLRDATDGGSDIIDAQAVQRAGYRAERRAAGQPDDTGDLPNRGYVTRKSNFALGYLMTAIANTQLAAQTGDANRLAEAQDNYREVLEIDAGLKPLVDRLMDTPSYNVILVVGFGLAPRKIATGPDGAIASYAPLTASDNRLLVARIDGGGIAQYPVTCDVNRMAFDHRWNDLEEARLAKSGIGSVLMGAGAVTTAYGADRRDGAVALAGLGLLLAGAVARGGAHADTRYCEVLPQRLYVVPLMVPSPQSHVELTIEGAPGSRMVLTGLSPPKSPSDPAVLRVVQLVEGGAIYEWPTTGQIIYSNDRTGAATSSAGGANLPYLLGGNCVREPTLEVLQSYQRSGFLLDWQLQDLRELYRAEGVQFDWRDGKYPGPGKHVLEGGNSMIAPQPGTTGFARLFGQKHPPYRPRSDYAKRAAAQVAKQLALQATPNPPGPNAPSAPPIDGTSPKKPLPSF